jgi:hypothetical protein
MKTSRFTGKENSRSPELPQVNFRAQTARLWPQNNENTCTKQSFADSFWQHVQGGCRQMTDQA